MEPQLTVSWRKAAKIVRQHYSLAYTPTRWQVEQEIAHLLRRMQGFGVYVHDYPLARRLGLL